MPEVQDLSQAGRRLDREPEPEDPETLRSEEFIFWVAHHVNQNRDRSHFGPPDQIVGALEALVSAGLTDVDRVILADALA